MSNVDVGLGIRDGQVLITWNGAREAIAFDPQNAFEFGEALARKAHVARFGEEPPPDSSYIAGQVRARVVDELRVRMTLRLTHVIRTMQRQEKTPNQIATQVVDILLAEVT